MRNQVFNIYLSQISTFKDFKDFSEPDPCLYLRKVRRGIPGPSSLGHRVYLHPWEGVICTLQNSKNWNSTAWNVVKDSGPNSFCVQGLHCIYHISLFLFSISYFIWYFLVHRHATCIFQNIVNVYSLQDLRLLPS